MRRSWCRVHQRKVWVGLADGVAGDMRRVQHRYGLGCTNMRLVLQVAVQVRE